MMDINSSFCGQLSQIFEYPILQTLLHACDKITKSDIYLDSVSCNCFHTIQLLAVTCAPTF